MRETFNSILTKIIIVMIIVFLMFGESVVLKIYNSGTGLFGFMQSEVTETVSPEAPRLEEPEPKEAPTEAATAVSSPLNAFLNGKNNNIIADIVEEYGSGVVNIETKVVTRSSDNPLFNDPFFRQFFGGGEREYVQSGLGTGFIISEDGYIVTNQHVIENATEINVIMAGQEEPYTAEVIGEDHDLDLAVIKIEAKGRLKPLKLGNSSDIRVGEWVTAIGNPYGLDHTVTVGVISAVGRPITIGDRTYKDLIQTDAAINPGNSGGPLINLNGEVVGINTAVSAQAQGIGFAISINTAKDVLDELITRGKVVRPYMGISMQNLSEEAAGMLGIEPKGVLIASVVDNTPAAAAGLQQYDVIVRMNDADIADINDLQDFLATCHAGDTVQLHVMRDRQETDQSIVLGEKP